MATRTPPLEIHYRTLTHRWGKAALAGDDRGLIALALVGGRTGLLKLLATHKIPCRKLIKTIEQHPHLGPAASWLDALLNKGRYHAPAIQIASPSGTLFQMKIWRAVLKIPPGETRTYAQIARTIGHPRAARAAGAANARNPLPLFIPCHRLVGSDGGLKNYAGGIAMKRWLLEIEKPL
ncbi:MAG: methylated-DNA--[protein]-cysteine S-methyltransferase [Nitrospinaceae bacterium]|jgi:methylated-DNA-[protein]-cysteine S-methyltransferase|nr:methylated-DNA--[protein]-cysteine S-methyltransferase [Nitrospinaceae bacterium]MBT3435077.1 methylated-DNA--[protein]-cysteine S-methyltransferase [Nitrospinaceae bacterium]MBT3821390.1 methylated-DNA--[protein]-cysteine S-methyltransferase [Nitrospinaceae bacterium]MBT4095562.1 methylated-DNA--[protein]-cysteine S-methyltransferase [Nitrospinaceae bacterium]MBT4429228.1 methylated-DNA--[protein]-cysteine S-methyltransferase [Nitrospinaceae bacterium]